MFSKKFAVLKKVSVASLEHCNDSTTHRPIAKSSFSVLTFKCSKLLIL